MSSKFTDTDRLNWVLGFSPEFDCRVENERVVKFWARWFHESKWHVAYGADPRSCIDAALRGEVNTFS